MKFLFWTIRDMFRPSAEEFPIKGFCDQAWTVWKLLSSSHSPRKPEITSFKWFNIWVADLFPFSLKSHTCRWFGNCFIKLTMNDIVSGYIYRLYWGYPPGLGLLLVYYVCIFLRRFYCFHSSLKFNPITWACLHTYQLSSVSGEFKRSLATVWTFIFKQWTYHLVI